MAQDKLIRGWMVSEMGTDNPASEKYFLDVNNAVAYCDRQGKSGSLYVQQQYIRPEWAEDLHKSRMRREPDRER